MNVLILGGNSQKHHEWVRDVAEAVRPEFAEVRLLDYAHWAEPDAEIDLEHEIAEASKLAEGFDPYIVVAKSIGTVVATLAIARGLLKPERCVFLGFPLVAVEGKMPEVAKALAQLPHTDFVHNEFDTIGFADDAQAYIDEAEPAEYSFQKVPGNRTHSYVDFDLIRDLSLAA